MTWTRLSDDFTLRPSVLGLSDSAFRLHIEAMVYSNHQLTDGAFPRAMVARWSSAADSVALESELIAVGLWTVEGDGLRVTDWERDQESASTVQRRRDEGNARQARSRARYKLHRQGDHSTCLPSMCQHAVTRDTRVSDSDPTRPDPTPKGGKGKGGLGGTTPEASPAIAPSSDEGVAVDWTQIDQTPADFKAAAKKLAANPHGTGFNFNLNLEDDDEFDGRFAEVTLEVGGYDAWVNWQCDQDSPFSLGVFLEHGGDTTRKLPPEAIVAARKAMTNLALILDGDFEEDTRALMIKRITRGDLLSARMATLAQIAHDINQADTKANGGAQ